MRLRSLLALVPLLALAAGCAAKKINETKTLEPLDKETGARSYEIPAQKKAKTVTVDFSSSDGEVTVLAFKASDIKQDDDMLTLETTKALGRNKGKAGGFTVEMPADTAIRIVARGHTAAKTEVTLKVVEQ